jgi:hypothetical protein
MLLLPSSLICLKKYKIIYFGTEGIHVILNTFFLFYTVGELR